MSQADNGKTAYAIPLSGIAIDGKLDDWPEQMAIYPIDWISAIYKPTPPEGPDDLTASFRVGYDLEASLAIWPLWFRTRTWSFIKKHRAT